MSDGTKNNKKTQSPFSTDVLASNSDQKKTDVSTEQSFEEKSFSEEDREFASSSTRVIAANRPQYVVGIGASAGGLEAIQELIEMIPTQSNMAFVVIQHLSPDYRSMMDELLRRKTTIRVCLSEDRMLLEANTIYVLPPKKEMIVANGRLLLADRTQTDVLNLPINTFFRSLAESYQERAICIVLSGTGSDGTTGANIVHDNGGMVIVQSPETAAFDGMPNSAISMGKADLILRPAEMPMAVVKYALRTSSVIEQIANTTHQEENRFAEIALLLDTRFGLDLSQYKPSTITRRIERRLSMQGCSLRDYTTLLIDNRNELDALYQDLLIGVTHFFRDEQAFNSIRSEVSHLVKRFRKEPELRIWVAGCATGQEAYSLAILCMEAIEDKSLNVKFRIFATDIHQRSIDRAARGVFADEEITGIDDARKSRYFNKCSDGYYQVSKELRNHVVFAQHNVLEDPPFTNIHLLSCRNLLIYFNQSAQQRVLSLFTFALRNEGILFLGSSESLGGHEIDFKITDSKNKIFQKKGDSRERPQVLGLKLDRAFKTQRKLVERGASAGNIDFTKRQKAQEILLQRFVPPSILVDDNADVLHVYGNAGQFLSFDSGSATLNLRSFVSDEGKMIISHLLNQVKAKRKPVKSMAVKGFINCDFVDVHIAPLSNSPGDIEYMIVTLEESNVSALSHDTDPELVTHSDSSLVTIKELEDELQFTRESLQSTVEELETSNEELQATNEELMAANEEMQTTNEELQSVNEELLTVNAEFSLKEKQKNEAEADEKSVIDTSGANILFLDEHLNIRKVAGSISTLLDIGDGDIGRPFAAVGSIAVQSLLADVNKVLNDGGLIEKEFASSEEVHQLQVRRLESANDDDQAEYRGVILTFINISKMHSAQSRMAQSEERLQSVLDHLTDGYIEWERGDETVYLSDYIAKALGYENENQFNWLTLLGNGYDEVMQQFNRCYSSREKLSHILRLKTKERQTFSVLCKGGFDIQEKEGQTERFSGQLIDVNYFSKLEAKLTARMKDLSRSNEILEEFAHIVSHDLKAPLRHAGHSLTFLHEAMASSDQDAANEEIIALDGHVDRLKKLIDEVIRFSRVGSEKKKESTIDLNEVVSSALELCVHQIKEAGVVVRRDHLPIIKGDKAMLLHVFQNLIGNACKYNDKDEKRIEIRCEQDSEFCQIHIYDNGMGFDLRYKENIFKPFKRLVTNDEIEGSGIGLSICKMLVDQHHGEIDCDSSIGEGSTFTLKLPLIKN